MREKTSVTRGEISIGAAQHVQDKGESISTSGALLPDVPAFHQIKNNYLPSKKGTYCTVLLASSPAVHTSTR